MSRLRNDMNKLYDILTCLIVHHKGLAPEDKLADEVRDLCDDIWNDPIFTEEDRDLFRGDSPDPLVNSYPIGPLGYTGRHYMVLWESLQKYPQHGTEIRAAMKKLWDTLLIDTEKQVIGDRHADI